MYCAHLLCLFCVDQLLILLRVAYLSCVVYLPGTSCVLCAVSFVHVVSSARCVLCVVCYVWAIINSPLLPSARQSEHSVMQRNSLASQPETHYSLEYHARTASTTASNCLSTIPSTPSFGVFRSRNGAPSRKRCMVNDQMTEASNE